MQIDLHRENAILLYEGILLQCKLTELFISAEMFSLFSMRKVPFLFKYTSRDYKESFSMLVKMSSLPCTAGTSTTSQNKAKGSCAFGCLLDSP